MCRFPDEWTEDYSVTRLSRTISGESVHNCVLPQVGHEGKKTLRSRYHENVHYIFAVPRNYIKHGSQQKLNEVTENVYCQVKDNLIITLIFNSPC